MNPGRRGARGVDFGCRHERKFLAAEDDFVGLRNSSAFRQRLCRLSTVAGRANPQAHAGLVIAEKKALV